MLLTFTLAEVAGVPGRDSHISTSLQSKLSETQSPGIVRVGEMAQRQETLEK